MSKESPERGLDLSTRARYDRATQRVEKDARRGVFHPEPQDVARLLPRLAEAPRR